MSSFQFGELGKRLEKQDKETDLGVFNGEGNEEDL